MHLRAAALAIVLCTTAAVAQDTSEPKTIARGEALVPPGDYRHGATTLDPARYDPAESGTIYDFAYGGIAKGKLLFRHRGYSIQDLTSPGYEQELSFPADQTEISLREIVVHVLKASPESLTYTVSFLPPVEMTNDPCETDICTAVQPGTPEEAQP